ncbi:MAG: 30S ribosomal protein S6 [Patescibacteria group bacterium]|nr:30S ribosomal protein S6 [Patescibacteria group bacterium]
MRNYEVSVVLHPDLEIDIANALDKIEKIISKSNAKIVKKDNWGKRKLAYKVNKQDWGIYVFYNIEVDPAKVSDINQALRITEEVMRYLIVSTENIRYITKPNETAKPKAAPKAAPVASKEAKPAKETKVLKGEDK